MSVHGVVHLARFPRFEDGLERGSGVPPVDERPAVLAFADDPVLFRPYRVRQPSEPRTVPIHHPGSDDENLQTAVGICLPTGPFGVVIDLRLSTGFHGGILANGF